MRNKAVIKIANLAVLSALGIGLMMLGQILRYPPAPFLELEPSDVVILVGYAMYGFQGAFLVALIKTLLYLLITGPVGAIAVGQLTAFLTSLTYCFGLFLTARVLRLFKRGIVGRATSYAIISLFVALVLTIANFLFLTPTFILGRPATFLSAWDFDFATAGIDIKGAYPVVIIALYVPFNLLKGAIVCILYEILFNRVIFHLLKTDRRFKIYFSGALISLPSRKEKAASASASPSICADVYGVVIKLKDGSEFSYIGESDENETTVSKKAFKEHQLDEKCFSCEGEETKRLSPEDLDMMQDKFLAKYRADCLRVRFKSFNEK